MQYLCALTLLTLSLIGCVSSHSWLDCTNWIPNNPNNPGFSNSQGTCQGWARRFDNPPDKGFGKHDEMQFFRHYDQRAANNAPCRNQPSAAAAGSHEIRSNPVEAAYAPNRGLTGIPLFPMGTVQAGQRVCWRWPAKNHVAHVGNTVNDIEVNWANRPNYEPTSQQEWSSMKIHTASFKDCPTPFDILPAADQTGLGSERRACGTCFTLPANYQAGIYSVQWRWTGTTTTYTSCGDVRVTAQPAAPPAATTTPETLAFVSSPTRQDARTPSTLRLRYSVPIARQLIVDLLRDTTYAWYGKGTVQVPAGAGEIDVTWIPTITAPNGADFFFNAYLTTTQAYQANAGNAWRAATRFTSARTTIVGSNVPASSYYDPKNDTITFMRDGIPTMIASSSTSLDVGVSLTTTGERIVKIEISNNQKIYASTQVAIRQGISSSLMIPVTVRTPFPMDPSTSLNSSSDAYVPYTIRISLYNGATLIQSDIATTTLGVITLYPVEERISYVTDSNSGIHSIWKAGSTVDIPISYAASASRTIWLRLLDSNNNTVIESSRDVTGGRGTIRMIWTLPITLSFNGIYPLETRLIDSYIFHTNKNGIEQDMGIFSTLKITIGNENQPRLVTSQDNSNNNIQQQASAPSVYEDVLGGKETSGASITFTMSSWVSLFVVAMALMI